MGRLCTSSIIYIYRKVKWFRYQPGVVQRVGRGIALLFHDRGTRSGWVVISTPRLHFTPGKEPVPILQEAGWAPGPVWTGGKSRPHRDSIPDRPARSQSLYRLSYSAHQIYIYIFVYIYLFKYSQYLHAYYLFIFCIYTLYSVSQEECARLREGVPCVKVYRYNPKHLSPKWNLYGDNGQSKVWSSCGSTHCNCRLTLTFPSALNVASHVKLSAGRWAVNFIA